MTALSVRHVTVDLKATTGPRTFDVVRVGYLPGEGWTCAAGCRRGCVHVTTVRDYLREISK